MQVEVLTYEKIFADGGPVTGSFTAAPPFAKGHVTFHWDNSYSKLTAKTVTFKLVFE